MELSRLINSKGIANNIWKQRQYYRFENFRVEDICKLYLGLHDDSNLKSRKVHFVLFIKRFKNTPIHELNSSEVSDWFQQIKLERNLTDKTLLQIKCQLNPVFKWLIQEQIITTNPLTTIKLKRNLPPRRHRCILSTKELKAIIEEVKTYDQTILYPLLYAIVLTGARRSEILNLKWDNVDLEHRSIIFEWTKNGSDRRLKITSKLHELLSTKVRTSEYVFPDQKGHKIGRMQIQRMIKKFKEAHHFEKDWQLHDFRHSFANNFLKKGGEMYQLQAILGHKSIQMTVDLYGNLKSHDIEESSPYDF